MAGDDGSDTLHLAFPINAYLFVNFILIQLISFKYDSRSIFNLSTYSKKHTHTIANFSLFFLLNIAAPNTTVNYLDAGGAWSLRI